MASDPYYSLTLTPAVVVVAVLGAACGAGDTLALFHLSLLVRHLLLVTGTFVLCRQLLLSRTATWFVCLGTAATTFSLVQNTFNLEIFCLLPVQLACLVRFHRTRRPRYLWLVGVVEVAALLGSTPYVAGMHLVLVATFVAVSLCVRRVGRRRMFRHSTADVVALAAFAAAAVGLGITVRSAFDHMRILSKGRDPETGRLTLQTFLVHGGQPGHGELNRMFLAGEPSFGIWGGVPGDIVVYAGLAAPLLAAYALVRVRSRTFLPVAGTGLVLLWIAAGGSAAAVLYYVPLVSLYRHFGFLHPTFRIFVLLAAGFGLDHLRRRIGLRHLVAATLLLVALPDLYYGGRIPLQVLPSILVDPAQAWNGGLPLLPVRVLVYVAALAAVAAIDRKRFAAPSAGPDRRVAPLRGEFLFLAAFAFDVVGFGALVHGHFDGPPDLRERLGRPEPLPFAMQRRPVPYTGPVARLLEWNERHGGISYETAQLLLRIDGGRGADGTDPIMDNPFVAPWSDRDETTVFQHLDRRPKLLLARSVVVAHDRDAALATLREDLLREVTDRLVLLAEDAPAEEVALAARSVPPADGTDEARIDVAHFEPDEIRIRAEFSGTGPRWLVYADGYDPEWTATVDGEPRSVLRAAPGIKAVRIDQPGSHEVVFAFRAGRLFTSNRLMVAMGLVLFPTLLALLWHLGRTRM
jgi:hypothetical protein